ncbi:MAG: hypothetical protein GY754_10780, partial [bacterium]|nr:hypothetical protein [bacterium]
MKKTVILIVSLFFISTFISSCDKTQPGGGTTPTGKIKEPVIDIPAESAAYKTLWKSVEDYRGKGLPKSSLKVVNRIYSKASKEENAGQIIKALIHKIYYIQQVEEETIVTIQAELNRELKKSSHPVTPVLHSMIAEQYWNYYQRNRYRFLKRSTAKKVKQDDMRTWDLRKIVEEVVAHYEKSLEKPELLKKIKIDIYDEVLYRGNSQRKYRPTLYDFLAHRAIDFYMNQEAGLTRPVYRFSMNNTDYLLKEESFTALKLQTKEKLSFHYFALVYLQDMMRFHKSDRDPTALIDADLKRLRFVHKRAVLPGKERIFETVLKGMIERYKEHPSAAEIYHELGNLYNNQGNTYKAGRLPQYQWHKKKAWDLCKEAMEKYPKSTGAKYCKDLVVRIEAKRLQTTVEKAAIPRKPVKALLKYRNIDKIYVKAVKTTREEYREQQKKNYKKMVAFYAKKQGVRKEIIDLPGEKDFQENYTEIKTGS